MKKTPRVVVGSIKEIFSPIAAYGFFIYASANQTNIHLFLTSDQVGIPAELKHINKRRKRNQQGLP